MTTDKVIRECESATEANALYASGQWGMPKYSDRRDKYVMIKLREYAR